MKKLLQLSLFLVLVFNVLDVFSQQGNTMYYMREVQQSNLYNPAFRTSAKFNLGLPGINSIYFNFYNTIFSPKLLFGSQPADGQEVVNTQKFLNSLHKTDQIAFQLDVSFLQFSFQTKNSFISFNWNQRNMVRITSPKGLYELLAYGNGNFDQFPDGVVDLSKLGVDANVFQEIGLSWSRDLMDGKLRVGARAKYLYGMANIRTKKSQLELITDPDDYDIEFAGELDVRTSGITELIYDSLTPMWEEDPVSFALFGAKNKGFGVDLGAEYKFNDKLSVNLALKDLAFINYKHSTARFVNKDAYFLFRGLNLSKYLTLRTDSARNDQLDRDLSEIQDSLTQVTDFSEEESKYTYWLPTSFYLGAEYKLYDNDYASGTVTGLFRGEIYNGKFKPQFTVGYRQNVGRWLTLSMNYSVANKDWRNLGLGFQIGGPIQFYMVTDNILAGVMSELQIKNEDNEVLNTVPYPYFSRTIHVRTGVNIQTGIRDKDTDGDGVNNKDDLCPNTPGKAKFQGCPDRDGDGVPDRNDFCPDEFGSPEFYGCPDTDGDGVPDNADKCPDIEGSKDHDGCPDTDGDGIIDSEDACPESAGVSEFNGCPDTDADGIPDSKDECPSIAGTAEFNGCPDTDGDGLKDIDDDCPTIAGPIENKGCPYKDTDGDGVLDKDDECPETPGTVENKGCPELKKEEQEVLNTAFDNLEFESAKAVIKSSSNSALDGLANLMVSKPNWELKIAGHTDSDGNDNDNMKLSEERAKAVAKYLVSKGVNESQLKVEWYGETKPIADNETAEGKEKNRRVEMNIEFK